MSDDVAISVCNVSKCYQVFENQRARLRHALIPSATKGFSEVWALRDINFDVKRGESFGIIGRNGAGKSTLLEIITQTLTPTSGTATVRGRVAALLELGSGFNPEYTGRENVFLNGLLLGVSRADVERRFDEIVGFADIGNVLDRPVKTYSSGMVIRLAFAVQVALEPEILIVDEALSVGDYFFQQKCFGRLRQMRENGLTLLFVSHDMGTVRDLCERTLYLNQGVQKYQGEASEGIRMFFTDGRPATVLQDPIANPLPQTNIDVDLMSRITAGAIWSKATEAALRLLAVQTFDAAGNPTESVILGTTMTIRVYFRLYGSGRLLNLGLQLKNKYDQTIFSINTRIMEIQVLDSSDQSISAFEFKIDMNIEGGLYSLKIFCNDMSAPEESERRDETEWIGPLRVDWDYATKTAPFNGMFGIPIRGKNLASDNFLCL